MTTAAGHDEERRAPAVRLEHPPVAERRARGRAARADVPRSAHAELDPGPDRPDPIALLQEQAKTRVPELVPIRYGRMLSSPFAFYRGAALVMASDLSTTPTTALRVQLCGDAHLSNFGAFGSPERRLVFDINDFDETLPGPFEWDVKRLAGSFEVAGRERGFTSDERREIVLVYASVYRQAMAEFALQSNLEVFYAGLDVDDLLARYRASLPRRVGKRIAKGAAKSPTKDSLQALRRMTRLVDGEPRIVSDPPLIVPMAELLPEDRAAALRVVPRPAARVPADARDRSAPAARALPLRRAGPQGRRSGQRRQSRPHRAPARSRLGRPPPPAQGGAAVGAGAVRGAQPGTATPDTAWWRASV